MRFLATLSLFIALLIPPVYAEEPADSESGSEEEVPKTTLEEDLDPATVVPKSVLSETRRERLTLFLTSNVDGNLANPDCRADPVIDQRRHHWARQAAFFHSMRLTYEGAEQPTPLALSSGNMVFPGAISRYLLAQGAAGANNMVMSLVQVPFEAFSLGGRELSMPRTELLDFARAARQMRLRLQAANLRCEEFAGAEALCEAVGTTLGHDPFTIVRRGDLNVAVISLVDETIFTTLGYEQADGIRLLDPSEVLRPLISQMRQQADLVVVQYHVRQRHALERANALASDIPGIDLVITNHLLPHPESAASTPDPSPSSGGVERGGYIVAPSTGTHIISADSGPLAVILAHVDVVASRREGANDTGLSWRINRLDVQRIHNEDLQPHGDTTRFLDRVAQAYCEDWGRPIAADAPLAKPFERGDLQTYVLNVMRFSTRSEIALMNSQAFRDQHQFPLTEELTRADVYTMMPYNNQLVTAQVKGSVLGALAPRLGTELVATGLEIREGKVLINGRAPSPDRYYRVAMNDFLAHGGDQVFKEAQLQERRVFSPRWSAEPPAISDLVIRFIEERRFARRVPVTDALSPTGNFPDLHRRFLWTYTGSINAAYNRVNVVNPLVDEAPAYQQSQLTVTSTDQINLEGRAGVQADSRNHGWNNDLVLQYATARVDGDEGFEETKDLIRFRSQYRYLGLRADLGGRWWVPNPLTELQLETEFDRPETRDWHRLDLRGILGVSFRLVAPLEAKIGANMRQDVKQPDGEATWGLNAGYTLRRINLVSLLGRPIQFESEVEYFYNSIGQNNIQELRTSNRLFFAVFDQFFFTTTFNAFLFRTDAVGAFGSNTELTLGLHYVWETARQEF